MRKDRSAMLSQLNAYYDAYERELTELYEKASPMAGLLGTGGAPKDDRCHEIFYYNVEKWAKAFLASGPSQADAEAAVEWLLKLAQTHREDKTYWFCFAVQAHARELIPLMSREKALELQKWYNEAYPRVERLPAQKEVYKRLQKQSGQAAGRGFVLFRRK